jgi:hypothetical protein
MKKVALSFVGVLVVATVAYASLPSLRDDLRYWWAERGGQASSYGAYLQAWPNGRHAAEAGKLNDDLGWADAQRTGTLLGVGAYLVDHPRGSHAAEAFAAIETMRWQAANKATTIVGVRSYVDQYPNGRYVAEARARQEALRADEAPYLAAAKDGSEEALTRFLKDYPGHAREAEARAALTDLEGRDIVDLIGEKKVAVEVKGSGIQNVSVKLRRLVHYPIAVRIPVGTYFVSRDSSAQNMVTTAEEKRTLRTDEWEEFETSAACANRSLDVPGSEVSFAVLRSPQRAELVKLMPVLDKANAEYAVRQAAVWIVTDDASYDDLGTLVRGQFGISFGGTREINEVEAATAMKICEEAGIRLAAKAIWGDRQEILKGLPDGDLKKWLQAKR